MKVTDYTINGKCSCCGNCCSDLLVLTETEISKIKKLVEKEGIKPVLHEKNNFSCPFLNLENRCNIYEKRPWICRSYLCRNTSELILKSVKFIRKNAGKWRNISMRHEFFGDERNLNAFKKFI
jgi:hypothetical protein